MGYKMRPLTLEGLSYNSDLQIGTETNNNQDILTDNTLKVISRVLVNNGVNCTCVKIVKGIIEIQYHFELLDYSMTYEKIMKLKKSLLMYLKTKSLSIETSEEFIGFVVILPVKERPLINFANVMSLSPTYAKTTLANPLMLALGVNSKNQPVFLNLVEAPHLLVAGASGSGKSTCMHTIITSLMYSRLPGTLNLILIDPKQVEFAKYKNMRFYSQYCPIITNANDVPDILYNMISIMEYRYCVFKDKNVSNIDDYNKVFDKKSEKYFDRVVIIIDELADLILGNSKEIVSWLIKIAQMGRAAGIHLILSTQRPSHEVLPGLLRANIPAKIAFKVSSKTNSRIILDENGAEELIGNGDGLLCNGKDGELIHFQGCYLSDKDINKVVENVNTKIFIEN